MARNYARGTTFITQPNSITRQEQYGFSLCHVDGTPGHPPSCLQCPLIYFLTFPTHKYPSYLRKSLCVQLLTSQVISKSWTGDSRLHFNDLCTGSLLMLCGVQFYLYFCLLFVEFLATPCKYFVFIKSLKLSYISYV